ncbi:MAG TPA: ABC transporter permease [Dehalococcoidia bacterium]|jgi:ABC-2 type transport system permease protein|nr:ABC transporter permease [Dehalococcoidia bacterium]
MDLRFLTVAAKDIKILLRDRMAFAMLLGMPVMLIVILSFALKSEFEEGALELRLPTIDRDESPGSERLVQLLKETEGVTVDIKPAEAEDRLREQVRDGNYVAALIIPEGFADSLEKPDGGSLALLFDPTERAGQGIVRSVVLGAAAQVATGEAPGEDQGTTPINVATQFTDPSQEPGVYEQNVPGYAILAAFFMTMFVAGSILAERFLGTFRRLQAMPVSRVAVFSGKLLAGFSVGVVQMTLLFAFGFAVFGLSLGDQPLGLIPVTIGVVAAATGLGVLIAGFARTDQQATAFGTLIVLTMAALGGSMVPRFIMPDTMQTIGLITPHAWAIEGYHDVIVRDQGFVNILPTFAALLGFAVVFFAVGVARFRYQFAD